MSADTVHPPKPFTRSSGGEQSVFTALKHIKHLLVLALVSLLLVGCGGSGGGFQDADNVLRVQIYPVDGSYEMPWNPTLAPFDTRQPFTKTIRVEVRDHRNQLFSGSGINVDVTPSGEHGGLFVEEGNSGLTQVFFVSNNKPGTVTLTASVEDPASGRLVSATMRLTVVGDTHPVTSLTFTGPFVDAVRAGEFSSGLTQGESLQDGSYRRVISAVATDQDGNPPLIGTPIRFFLIDGPITGFPASPGRFLVAGSDGDPQEEGYQFTSPTGQFTSGGLLPGSRLVLDGQNFGAQPNNRALTGIRTVDRIIDARTLSIDTNGLPFNANPAGNTGASVPYAIGRAEVSNIHAVAYTNSAGVASTLLNYPVTQVGRTALLVACTDGREVCTVLNTCDANGQNCGSVFLPVSDGTNITLTASPAELGANTDTELTLCLRDENFTPIQAGQIRYTVPADLGLTVVSINNTVASAGSLITGAGGCVTATVSTSGQPPDSDPIELQFTADGVAEPIIVPVRSPGAGILSGVLTCGNPLSGDQCSAQVNCTVELQLLTDRGAPFADTTIQFSNDEPITSPSFTPSQGIFGLTDENGSSVFSGGFQTDRATSVTFTAGGADLGFSVEFPQCDIDPPDEETPQLPLASLVGGNVTIGPSGSTELGIALSNPARRNITVALLLTGATGQFTVPETVNIPTGQSSASFTVSANGATPGASIDIRLAGGDGYQIGAEDRVTVTVGEGVDPDVPVNSVVLVTSSPQLPSAGLEPVTLTAFVRDQNNVLIEGVDVTFSADNDGTLQVTRRTTDETGSAQAVLSTEGNKTNRNIRVTARVGNINDEVVVRVTGTNILIAGRRSALLGEQIRLDLTLRDSENVGIPNVPLEVDFTTEAGDILDASNLTTNNRGQASVLLGMTTAGENVVRVSGAGATATHPIDVSADQFEFVVPEPPGEDEDPPTVNLGVNQELTVRWEVAGVAQPGQEINFTATRGVLSATSANTNAAGEATVTISSNNAGPSVITATTPPPDVISAQLEILFVATEAAAMTLQAKPAVIGTNVAGETDQQSEIIAVVRDPTGNLVRGQTINFTLTDITGGTLSPASAVTDVFGRASTTYTAGTTPSAQDGVSIDAVVADTPTVEQTVTLTVARRDLFITLGTGNTIEKPDAVRYNLPYGVLVTDAAGNPVANAQVTIEAWPTGYYKGDWELDFGFIPARWIQQITAGLCPNEDVNRDGILNPGEDLNNNNQLDPGNVVTVSQANLVTDETGFADFNVVYFQQFAEWIKLELTARATVAGSEATEQVVFRLPILVDDTRGAASPPGNPSPFGRSNTCADDL